MKIIALEEHMVTSTLLDAWRQAPDEAEEQNAVFNGTGLMGERLLDVDARRLQDMDDQGVDVQVLSVTQPGVQNLTPSLAVPLAKQVNDRISAAVSRHPGRFEAFAALPTPDPRAAVEELRRAVQELGFMGAMVFGRTGSRNADHPDNEPIWAAASDLRVPIYLHPQRPQNSIRNGYYSGLGDPVDRALSTAAVGWHFETGIQLIRMILAGVFDRHPGLQLVIGHWGELMLFWEERFTSIQRAGLLPSGPTVLDVFREHVSFTGSGDTSHRYLRWAKEVVGIDRILFATDYPFIDNSAGMARSFLNEADLTTDERAAVAHANWERLTAHLR
ncbi:amidohydrolase family protein [Amycolatopsis sp. H20-H5]|uniref:amidohydrolase family protein n=1 Tax=Amycolatopsis sp. H20-H5 TaxID=3046309 RepID=UPI002DB5FD99|nr:amidohydrolase family protein [Amycolatopsis sp. H20-H5]MEC3977407.1 amidohydrolase family protein [Amycolatopsis sp. H20-H5]